MSDRRDTSTHTSRDVGKIAPEVHRRVPDACPEVQYARDGAALRREDLVHVPHLVLGEELRLLSGDSDIARVYREVFVGELVEFRTIHGP